MPDSFVEYFRCPESLATLEPCDHLSREEGYFRWGDAICYGRRSGGAPSRHVTTRLDEVGNAAWNGGGPRLPFDLTEVVTNLRWERYRRHTGHPWERITAAAAVQTAYYLLRPILPVSIRRRFQRIRLSGWDQIEFPRWPVDSTVDTLMEQTMMLLLKADAVDRVPFIWFWPDGARSCAIMTHDIETTRGRDFCAALIDLDDRWGIKAAFQVVPEGGYAVPDAFLEGIRSRGCEINVHDLNHDGRLFLSRHEFVRRAAKINEHGRRYKTRGFRAGAMYRRQDWFDQLDFSYDMSVPSVAHLEPQRGGCCTVMPYFIGDVVELPLTTIQDYSLFNILQDYSVDLWKDQIDAIVAKHGLISFITHPDYLIEDRAQAVYVQLLDHLGALRDAGVTWISLPRDVDRWWRSRRGMVLRPQGTSWRIEGPDSERARLAYAFLRDGRLVYSVEASS